MDREVIQLHDLDNVGTVMREVQAGSIVHIHAPNRSYSLQIVEFIPEGHKVSLNSMSIGQKIIKYGHCIGITSQDIGVGQHVHLHNLSSVRGGVRVNE